MGELRDSKTVHRQRTGRVNAEYSRQDAIRIRRDRLSLAAQAAQRSEQDWTSRAILVVAYERAVAKMTTNTAARLTDNEPNCLEIVYTWQDCREEVRYRRSVNSAGALELINEVLDLQKRHGDACPYSYREVYQHGF